MKSVSKFRKAASVASVFAFVIATEAQAFGLRSHLYIGEEILVDAEDCSVSVAGTEQEIPDEVCEALERHPGAFLAGTIGPDAFPDIVIGQSYIHPGAKDGRKSADWFEILLQSARTPEEVAFAYGNLVHASGDMFAHSYVNNYSGGTFEILKNRHKDIELRHFLIEKYIDQRLEYEVDEKIDLEVPSKFVVETLIETSYFSKGYHFTPGKLLDALKDPKGAVGREFFSKLSSAKAASHAILMHAALELARAAKQDLPCDAAKAEQRLVEAHRTYLLEEARARAEAGVEDIALSLPEVPEAINCGTSHPEGFIDQSVIELKSLMENQIDQTALLQTASNAIDERLAYWETVDRSSQNSLANAYANYADAVVERNQKRALARFAKAWADEVQLASQEYIEAGLNTARLMVENSKPHPPALHERHPGSLYYDQWTECYLPVYFGQPIAAGRAKCDRLSDMGMPMSLSEAAMGAGMGKMPRNLAYRFLDFKRRLDAFFMRLAKVAGRMVAPSTVELLEQIYHPSRITREKLNEVFKRGRNGQLEFACVSDWIDADLGIIEAFPEALVEGERPCAIVEDDKRGAFLDTTAFAPMRHAVTMGKLALLDKEGVRNLVRNVAPQQDLSGSIQFSQATIRNNDTESDGSGRYSVILDTPLSLDGSYQWQGLHMPYPRRVKYRDGDHGTPGAGYPIRLQAGEVIVDGPAMNSKRKGFPLYQSEELRDKVFSKIFPIPFEGEILKRPEMQPPFYPFRPCEGDPFRPYSESASTILCHTVNERSH